MLVRQDGRPLMSRNEYYIHVRMQSSINQLAVIDVVLVCPLFSLLQHIYQVLECLDIHRDTHIVKRDHVFGGLGWKLCDQMQSC